MKKIILTLSSIILYNYITLCAAHLPLAENLTRIQKETTARTLRTHIQKNIQAFNTIRVEAIIDKNRDFDDAEAWEEFVANATELCQAATNEGWISDSNIEINEQSKTTTIQYKFGAAEIGLQGVINVILGAADCCKDCYPICLCAHKQNEKCACDGNPGKCLQK